MDHDAPLVVSYGMGVDSTAMLVGLAQRRIRPDLILFADVGDENPETYAYQPAIRRWLAKQGFPPVRTVRYVPKRFKCGPYSTLYGNCWQNRTLPSLAFGRKSCSNKWKIASMDKEVRRAYAEHFAAGGHVVRAIGYDAGPKDSCRGGNITDSEKFRYWYPLRDWGWGRERCKDEIAAAGLPIPCKSACFFCPSTQKHELERLAEVHPSLASLAVAMEDRAKPGLRTVEGLWRRAVKGTRDPLAKRPGDWRTYLEQTGHIDALPAVDEAAISKRL